MTSTAGIVTAVFALAACGGSSGPATRFNAALAGAYEVPVNQSAATGTASYTVNGTTVNYTITYTGLSSAPTGSHIHVGPAGINGGVVVPFTGLPATTSGTFSGSFTASNVGAGTAGGVTITAGSLDSLLTAMRAGNTYTNVHAASPYAGGEIRGQNQPQ
jgi:hypothetical protein